MKNSKIFWANNLEVNISNKLITATTTHSQLYSTNSLLDKQLGNPQANSLAVNIGFLLSQPSKHGEYYVSIPINVPGYNFFSVANSYVNQEYSAQSLEMRHILGRDNNVHTNATQKKGPYSYYENSNKYYPQPFHHSEQAFYEYIIQRSNIDNVVKRLIEYGVQKNTIIEAITIDMHSMRYVCGNCEIGGLGLINANYSFILTLSSALHDEGLQTAESIKIIPRVSANKPSKGSIVTAAQHKDIGNLELGSVFLEASTNVYKLANISTDLHNRSIFTSSEVRSNSNYSSTHYNLLQQEYIEMVNHGKNLARHTSLNPKKTGDGILIVQDNLFYSTKKIDDLENAFYELSKLDNQNYSESDNRLANGIIEARREIEYEIAAEYQKFIQIKHELNEAGVSLKTTTSLKNEYLKILKDLPEILELIKNYIIDFDTLLNIPVQELEGIFSNTDVYEILEDEDITFNDLLELYRYYIKNSKSEYFKDFIDLVEKSRTLMEERDLEIEDIISDPRHLIFVYDDPHDYLLSNSDTVDKEILDFALNNGYIDEDNLLDIRSELGEASLQNFDMRMGFYENSESTCDYDEDDLSDSDNVESTYKEFFDNQAQLTNSKDVLHIGDLFTHSDLK